MATRRLDLRTTIAAALLLLVAEGAGAVDLSGSATLSAGTTDTGDQEVDLLDEQASFSLFQRLTPYLSLRAGGSYVSLETDDGTTEVNRRTTEPQVALLYNRPTVSGRLVWLDRIAEGSFATDDYEVTSLLGHLTWRPRRGPSYTLRYRDEENVADSALFGRDTASRLAALDVLYGRTYWSAGYTYEDTELENRSTGLLLAEERHEVRAGAARRFFADRLDLSFDGRASRVDRQDSIPAGAGLAEPVAARQGLFAVDPTPAAGELAPEPGLVDGDFASPAGGGIDIGGAASFRNLGVDLGFTLPVSRLEVAVTSPSGAGLPWEVWHSSDNIVWQRLPAVTATFDGALLRYTLAFPETSDRYFKAVNVGVNSITTPVLVTEVRALREVDGLVRPDGEDTDYRADVAVGFRPTRRVRTRFTAGASEEERLLGGVARRQLEEVHGTASVAVLLHDTLDFQTGYDYIDFEDRVDPDLSRSEERLFATLTWTPLPAIVAQLLASEREEASELGLLRRASTVRLRVDTEILRDLRLVSELEESSIEEPLFGPDREIRAWRETIHARPTARWDLTGGYSRVDYTDAQGADILSRTGWDLQTTWRATDMLSLVGSWAAGEEGEFDYLRQSYGVSWQPAPRLSLSGSWDRIEDGDVREVTTSSGTVSYRFNPRLDLFATLSRSELVDLFARDETTSFRAGFSLFF